MRADLKSLGRKAVRVRPPPSAPLAFLWIGSPRVQAAEDISPDARPSPFSRSSYRNDQSSSRLARSSISFATASQSSSGPRSVV